MGDSERSDRMSELIGRSSLGTNEARLIRSYTSASDVAEVLKSAENLRARGRTRARTSNPGMARRFSTPADRRPAARGLPGPLSVARTLLWSLAGVGVVTSGLLLVAADRQPRGLVVGATTAALISAASLVTEWCRRAAPAADPVPPLAKPQRVAMSVDEGVAEERAGRHSGNGGINGGVR